MKSVQEVAGDAVEGAGGDGGSPRLPRRTRQRSKITNRERANP